jgi:hypothetical protein
VKLKNPIEQHMIGHGGLFRQQNVEKRRVLSVREWAELCKTEDRRAPGVDDISLHYARRAAPPPPPKTRAKRGERAKAELTKASSAARPAPVPASEVDNAALAGSLPPSPNSPPHDEDLKAAAPIASPSASGLKMEQPADDVFPSTPEHLKEEEEENTDDDDGDKPQKTKAKRKWQTREMREAHLAERAAADAIFLKSFDPRTDWLPSNTRSEDYTPEFCKDLERRFWRNCGIGAPAMYGADMEGWTRGFCFSNYLTLAFFNRVVVHEQNKNMERCSSPIFT